jgi:hypothetical protein
LGWVVIPFTVSLVTSPPTVATAVVCIGVVMVLVVVGTGVIIDIGSGIVGIGGT